MNKLLYTKPVLPPIPIHRMFVVGGKNIEANLDMSVDDALFGFRRKYEGKFSVKGQRDISSFLVPADDEEDDRKVPYGLALLFSEGPMTHLKLTRSQKFIKIDSELKKMLKDHVVDLVVYGSDADTNRCLIFEELHRPFVVPLQRQYMLREIDPEQVDLSLNRCTIRSDGFLPESFRLGQPTPGAENDCTGEKLILEEEPTMQSVQEEKLPADLPSFHNEEYMSEDIPMEESCIPSSQPASRYRSISPEKLKEAAKKKMRLNEGTCSEAAQSGVSSSAGGDFEKDKLLEERASRLFSKPYELDEFESTRRFHSSWAEDIKRHQKKLLPWLSIQSKKTIQRWFEYLPNSGDMTQSRYRCWVCFENYDNLPQLTANHKPNLATEHGVLYKDYSKNQDLINRHASSATHTKILQILREQKRHTSLTKKFNQLEEEEQKKNENLYRATTNMMRMVYTEVMLNIPLASHNTMVALMHLSGAPKGFHHYERRSAQRIVDFISSEMHYRLLAFLNTRHGFDPVSLIVDGSTDPRQNHYLICYLQVLQNNYPFVYFYRLIPMRHGERAQDIYDTLIDAWVEDGIKDYMQQNLVGYGADGAAVMMGKKTGLRKLLDDFTHRKLVPVHCMAHRVHLAIKRAFDQYNFMRHFEIAINGLYTFYYSHGHKRKNHLRNFAGGQILELSYIFETRWISSELKAIKRMIKNYPYLMGDLDELKSHRDFDPKTHNLATGLYNQLADRYLIELLFFMGDLLNHLAKYSLEMQRRSGILVEQWEIMDSLLRILRKAASYEEGNMIDLLRNSRCGHSEEQQEQGCSMKEFEESESVSFHGHFLIKRKNSVYKPLTDIRFDLIESLIIELKSYLPLKEMQPFDILDPKKIPEKLEDQTFYGVEEIKKLGELYGIPSLHLVEAWKKLQQDMTESDEWCTMKGSKAREYWKHFLASTSGIKIHEDLRNLINSILVTPISSADAERGFSILFHTRSSRRSRLTPEHLEGMMRLRINGPKNIALFPALKYAKRWHKAGKYLTDDLSHRPTYEPEDTIADDDPDDVASKKYLDGSNLF